MQEIIIKSLLAAQKTLTDFFHDAVQIETVSAIAREIAKAFKQGNKVIIFGNGGSMCDAMHFAEELSGKFKQDRPPLPALAISDPAYLTCVANDYGFEESFARLVSAFAQKNDVLIGISTSGNSENVINALNKGRQIGCKTIALLGKDGGKLKGMCDYEIIIPADTTDRIQEMHIKILHIIVDLVEQTLFYNHMQ